MLLCVLTTYDYLETESFLGNISGTLRCYQSEVRQKKTKKTEETTKYPECVALRYPSNQVVILLK